MAIRCCYKYRGRDFKHNAENRRFGFNFTLLCKAKLDLGLTDNSKCPKMSSKCKRGYKGFKTSEKFNKAVKVSNVTVRMMNRCIHRLVIEAKLRTVTLLGFWMLQIILFLGSITIKNHIFPIITVNLLIKNFCIALFW